MAPKIEVVVARGKIARKMPLTAIASDVFSAIGCSMEMVPEINAGRKVEFGSTF